MAAEQQLQGSYIVKFAGGSNWDRVGQKLTISNRTVSVLKFKTKKVGSPTGTITFTIRKVSNDAVLATKEWGSAGSVSTSAEWIQVSFATPTLVNEEVRILMEWSGTAGDASNYLEFWAEGSSVKANEQATRYYSTYTDTSTWDATYEYIYDSSSQRSVVTTEECTNTIAQQTTGWGHITVLGDDAPTQHGHVWSTSQTPTTDDSKTQLGAKPQTGNFTSLITGLTPSTTYYIRAYAEGPYGTAYGAQVSVVTLGTIGRRHIWEEQDAFHWFAESGAERKVEGVAVTSDHDLVPWLDPFS